MIINENFVNITKMLSYDKICNMLIGVRSNGKSFAVKTFVIDKALKKKELTFIYVRRNQENVKKAIKRYLNDIIEFYPKYDFKIFANVVYAKIKNTKSWFEIGMFIALSQEEEYKSQTFPFVDYLVFEEFITKGRYLTDELLKFKELCSTIFRRRKMKIFMLSNRITIDNIYFDYFKIKYDANKEYIVNENTILYNTPSFKEIAEKTDVAKLFNDEIEYFTGDDFLIDDDLFIINQYERKNIMFSINIDNKLLTAYRNDDTIIIGRYTRNNRNHYYFKTSDYINNAIFCNKSSYIYQTLKSKLRKGCLFFASQEIKNRMLDILK